MISRMNDAQVKISSLSGSTVSVARLGGWLSNPSVFASSSSSSSSMLSAPNLSQMYSMRAWCQTAELDYCPVVISIMSMVILMSFVTIIYLCAKTSFDWAIPASSSHCSCCCCCLPLINKFVHNRRCLSDERRRQFRRRSLHSFYNASSNYINDAVSLQSINESSRGVEAGTVAVTASASSSSHQARSTRSRAIWWITGGFATPNTNKDVDMAASNAALVAPPTYDESEQQQRRIMRANRSDILKHMIKFILI